jgi:extracellular factor (EF) 3-hydroxypalmitic acid methyl ester biosynthesis protein
VDFNDETIEYTRSILDDLRRRHGRRTLIQTHRRSVFNLLKDSLRRPGMGLGRSFDLIYCAGLFDYLSESVCRQVLGVCHGWLAPGGLLLATNVDANRPFRHVLEFLLDWHLTYRDGTRMAGLVPEGAPAGTWSVLSELSGVNVILEIRKPPGH